MLSRLSLIALAIVLPGCDSPATERGRDADGSISRTAVVTAAPTVASSSMRSDESREARHFDSERGRIEVTTIASGLEHPWAIAFLPDGRALVTERPGRLRIVDVDGVLSDPLAGVPEVHAQGQGGLLDVALSPGFDTDSMVYLSYSEPGDDGESGTSVLRARLDGEALVDAEVIFRQTPKLDARQHYGSRLVFDDEHLYITMGDRGQRIMAQQLDGHQGTVVRIRHDGGIPDDNPFVDDPAALDEVWSYGHRNIQGAALNPASGVLWTHEHGPRGGDEINLPRPGLNYGWPLVTHGINYSGEPIPEAQGTELEGMEPAHHVWEVSPGVSGLAFNDHVAAGGWRGNAFVGALATRELIRLELDGEEVRHEERLLGDLQRRIRDVRQGPDGALYLLTDHDDGELLRVRLVDGR